MAVLNDRSTGAEPYIAWVKEGRKYDLGAVLITQQPGSIPSEILSQGDNWFIFHLLSAGDLHNIQAANAHFSQDILSALLNEPIPGQGVFWSSSSGRSYPVAVRILSFERMVELQDPQYDREAVDTYAAHLKERFALAAEAGGGDRPGGWRRHTRNENGADPNLDPMVYYRAQAVKAVREQKDLMKYLTSSGAAWGFVLAVIKKALPADLHDLDQLAYDLVRPALEEIFGEQDVHWETFAHPQTGKTHIRQKHHVGTT